MLKHRVIPVLLLLDGGLYKTTKFKKPKYIGDPINAIRIFNDKEVDELMVLDIGASKNNSQPNYSLIEQFASECFMPLTYGGGIQTVEQARKLFSVGIEKICLQSAFFERPDLISELAKQFGSSSVVVSVDIKRNWLKTPKIFNAKISKVLRRDWIECISDLVKLGAGEVLLNSVDKDGTMLGPDLDLINKAGRFIDVPLIACGGISSKYDIKLAVEAGADAVAAGSFFVFHGPHRAVLITYPKYAELEELFT